MTREELENSIYGIIQSRLSITTIWAYGTTTSGAAISRPGKPYAMLNLVSFVSEGLPDGYGDAPQSGADYLEKLTEDRYVLCSVKTFGPGAWDKLSDLRRYLQTSTAQSLADEGEIGFSGIGEIIDLTAIDGAGWEQVCSVDLTIHYRDSIETDAGYLEAVDIDLTYKSGDTTIATDTIGVNDA